MIVDTTATSTHPGVAEDVLKFIPPGANVVIPIGFGEPPTLMDTIEAHAGELSGVRIHQMDPFVPRPYMRGEFGDHLRHVDYYLGPGSRQAYWDGGCDLVPNHFSEMPLLLRRVDPTLVIARAAGPDSHGYFSLGTNADYAAAFIGEVPFFLEVTDGQPFTYGQNQIHVSQVAGWIRTNAGFPTVARREPSALDHAIAGHIAELVPDGACLHGGVLRRVDEPRRERCRHRRAKDSAPQQARHHVHCRKPRADALAGPQRGRGTHARRLDQRSPGRGTRTKLRLHQCHHRGRPDGTGGQRDHRRTVLVFLRRPGGLRARGDVFTWRHGLPRSALHDEQGPRPDSLGADPRQRRHHLEEHRRPHRHRIRRRRATRRQHRRTGPAPHRHRPPRPPRRTALQRAQSRNSALNSLAAVRNWHSSTPARTPARAREGCPHEPFADEVREGACKTCVSWCGPRESETASGLDRD